MLRQVWRIGLSFEAAACSKQLEKSQADLFRRCYADQAAAKNRPWASRLWESLRGIGSKETSSNSAGSQSRNNDLVPSDPFSRHRQVLAIPLARKPLFPGTMVPLQITDKKLLDELVEQHNQGSEDLYVGAFLRKEPAEAGTEDQPVEASALHDIGTFAHVHTIHHASGAAHGGGAMVLLVGHRRVEQQKTVATNPLRVEVKHLPNQNFNRRDDVLVATTMEVVSTLKDLLTLHPLYNEHLRTFANVGGDLNNPDRLADMAASITSADQTALQGILEELDIVARMQKALMLVKKEVELCKLQLDIGKRVEEKISNDQRKYFLNEQLKSIKRELGMERDDKSAAVLKYHKLMDDMEDHTPEEAYKVIEDEIEKLAGLESSSAEFNVTRNYLDWLTSLPWKKQSEERLDLAHAKTVLNEDHYGLSDVKDRILEFIAVGKLRGNTTGKILCLVGPPGVGKTSVGKSIARALDRKYFRFSVGGLSDMAEIKGHRRTYIGAMPGKMVQCLKSTGVSNPLVLIDEIDKLGRGWQGDPSSAMLEMLDPEQNKTFLDHFLDVPVDLSNVLFMCTANELEPIPAPLLDRMEVINLSGYIANEKKHIARQYLEPQTRTESGIPEGNASLTDEALTRLITEYCREPGVRALRKHLEKIYRKLAMKIVQKADTARSSETVPEGVDGTASPSSGVTASGDGASAVLSGDEHSAASGTESEVASGEDDPAHTEPVLTAEAARAILADLASIESKDGSVEDSKRRHEQYVNMKAGYKLPLPDAEFGGNESGAVYLQNVDPITVDAPELVDYVGQPPFTNDKIYEITPPGVVMGLAYTSLGGSSLYIEAAAVERGRNKGSLKTTGQLGDVMKESAAIAHTFARSFALNEQKAPAVKLDKFFADTAIHMHVPTGGMPKEGPSAGCAIVTSLLSLALDKPVRPDLAMTGEVTLTGRVLPVGGIKEKLLAARRSGIQNIIFPGSNKKDYDELNDEVKLGVQAYFVEQYKDVFDLALDYDPSQVSDVKTGTEATL